MKSEFKGRSKELAKLRGAFQQEGFVMAAVYGRRGVGKTALIHRFMQEQHCRCISFTALEREEGELLSMMTDAVLFGLSPDLVGTVTFPDFRSLFAYVGRQAERERIIFFIDEYPNLTRKCPYIPSLLQTVIDTQWQAGNLFFILCGSQMSFMQDEVLSASSPLHGRNSLELKLRPLNYLETAEFLIGFTCAEKAICYGLSGGMLRYIRQFDPTRSLEENIIRQFYSEDGFFSEDLIQSVITDSRQDHALYSTILTAVAAGHTRHREIASFVGTDDVTYPLKVLVSAEILEKSAAIRPRYALGDTMLQFWFQYVTRATSSVCAGSGEMYYRSFVACHIQDYMGRVFRNMAKEYLLLRAGRGRIPALDEVSDCRTGVPAGGQRPRQIGIDLVGRHWQDILLVGACSFRKVPIEKEDVESLIGEVSDLSASRPLVCIFSLGGFAEDVPKTDDCLLIGIEDMYRQM